MVYVTWGYGRSIKCNVSEVEPEGERLLFQSQYRLDLTSNKLVLRRVPSPPLGMQMLQTKEWRNRLDEYLDTFLVKDFLGFPEVCIRGDHTRVQKDFLIPIYDYYMSASADVGHCPLTDLCTTDDPNRRRAH